MIERQDFDALLGAVVHGDHDDAIGTVRRAYVDDESGVITWAVVALGRDGVATRFVPLDDATLETALDGSSAVRVPFSAQDVVSSPEMPVDGHLSREQEAEVRAHYAHGLAPVDASEASDASHASDANGVGAVDAAPPQHADDTVMTRSEERLVVGTEDHETERVHLVRHVVVEDETVTVPLRREELHVVREPVGSAGGTDGTGGAELGPADEVVVLHEERPVVTTEVHEVERVRVVTDEVVEDTEVRAEVRREVVDVEREPVADDPTLEDDAASR